MALIGWTEIFQNPFIDHLFDLVEQTRDIEDETFNYSVIKLIVSLRVSSIFLFLTAFQVALNEQFMVALLPTNIPNKDRDRVDQKPEHENRVISILMRRLGSSRTFGENLIFMLNRAGNNRNSSFATTVVDVKLQDVHPKIFACNFWC